MADAHIHPDIQGLAVDITTLTPYPGNPRHGDVGLIAASLSFHGQYRPIVVNKPTGQVLAGNHTMMAAKQLGWTQLAVTYIEVDAEQAARIVAVDNRTSDAATYDQQALADLLTGLADLDGTGWDRDDLDKTLNDLATPLTLSDSDQASEPEVVTGCAPGRCWRLETALKTTT